MPKQKPISIDGTTLEGGGQILRLALALASLTQKPIDLHDIRGKRGAGGKEGGIKQAHLGGAAWLARAAEASTEGLTLRSRGLLFEPGLGTPQEIKEVMRQVNENGVGIGKAVRFVPGVKASDIPPLWNDVTESGKLIRRETAVTLSTPGSVFAVLQAILPFLLFRAQKPGSPSVPLRITIDGGTNVWHSMSFEWAVHVLFPMLHAHLGIGPIEMQLHKRSWSTGAISIGSVTFVIPPLAPSHIPLPAFSLVDRGPVTKIAVFAFAPNPTWRTALLDVTDSLLAQHFPGVPLEITDESSGHPARLYLLLIAYTQNNYRLGRDRLHAEKISPDRMGKIVLQVGKRVVEDLKGEIAHGGCVDEYLQDQLVVFQTLAKGRATVERKADASLHTRTARWVAERIAGVEWDEDGSCEGVEYVPQRGT